MAEWIRVKDRLPKPFKQVLVYALFGKRYKAVHEGFITERKCWYAGRFDDVPDEVFAWMPLPEPPKGE